MATIDTISTADGINGAKYELRHAQGAGVWNFISRVIGLMEYWAEIRRSRIWLAKLSEHELADIGISKAQAEFECSRPFWDISENCMR